MDNKYIDVISRGITDLELAIKLCWSDNGTREATHYKILDIDGKSTLILLWSKGHDALELVYPLSCDEAINFIHGWLARAPLGRAPDHDGDNTRGWRVFTEQWRKIASYDNVIAGFQAVWARHGK